MSKKHHHNPKNKASQTAKKNAKSVVSLEAVQRQKRDKLASQFQSRLTGRKTELLSQLDPAILATMTETEFDEKLRQHEEAALLAAQVKTSSDALEAQVVDEEGRQFNPGGLGRTRKAFAAHLNKAIAEADVIIEVLDARDPHGYRSEEVEQQCLAAGKKVILLINKIDLVPDISIIEEWEAYLRKFYPTVAFRAMTTDSRSKHSTVKFGNLKATRAPHNLLKSGYEPLGAVELMNLLKNYSRTTHDLNAQPPAVDEMADAPPDGGNKAPSFKSIVVAVIGMPNVGKSSVINSLCRNTNKVKTGNEAGVTRNLSRVKLSEHIQLIDTPGVIMQGDEHDAQSVIRGCIKSWPQETGEAAVDLLRQLPEMKEQFMKNYHISEGEFFASDVRELLTAIAWGRKHVKKGGEPDIAAATRLVLEDWKVSKIKAFAKPPQQTTTQQWMATPAPALDLDALAGR